MKTDIAEAVRERYAGAALRVRDGGGCCSGSEVCCAGSHSDQSVSVGLYDASQISGLPEEAVLASLGCGNPTALIELREGETVLDLGSGGGIDVLLAAKRVGPKGFVFGLDMTDEMLELAQRNKEAARAANVAFLRGRIEDIPLPSDSIDVVMSNCVINLAADKSLVLKEAARVIKPGGRLAVADVIADGPVPDELRRNLESWVGCVAGALDIDTYPSLLQSAHFQDISIEIIRRYTADEAGLDTSPLPSGWQTADGRIASAFIRARQPSD
ncbi:MAG: arsenite methyltransferase [Chloroflexota bacterium]